jgi:four helix bundle protein
MRRAALSIPTNIAEGAGRPTRPDYGRFLSISLGSVNELQYLLVVARDLGYLESAAYRALHEPLVEVRRMLLALRRSVVAGS